MRLQYTQHGPSVSVKLHFRPLRIRHARTIAIVDPGVRQSVYLTHGRAVQKRQNRRPVKGTDP